MAQVIVRKIDSRVVAALKRKAKLGGRSLERELRETLTRAARLGAGERRALARRIRALTPKGRQTDSTELLRRDRAR